MRDINNKIIFLGTGTSQGVPPIGCTHPVCLSTNAKDKRLRSSIFIHYKQKKILIDCGPDFRQQMLRSQLTDVDFILITHEHNDHIIGLDDVRPINFKQNKDMPIYALPRVMRQLKSRFNYAFGDIKYPGLPAFEPIEIGLEAFIADGIEITPIEVLHGKLPILGYRIGSIAYLTDVSHLPAKEYKKLEDLEILIISSLRKEPTHHAHMTLAESLILSQKIKAKKTYLTHISHMMGFHEDVQRELPENVFLAFDELSISF